ncbi:hypothetical protein M8J77_024147 [Diaphorina citri]|nr:hypothetical protein M8J77_024147 [Diaphorina citri]
MSVANCLSIKASETYADNSNARASPSCDAQIPRLTSVRSEQGLPGQKQGWARLKKQVLCKIRIGTLNVGSMTSRGREIADMMVRRKIHVLCVQETRWKGGKAKELGEGCKIFYSGANGNGRNGVGIVLDDEMKEKVTQVNRRSDRLMSMKIELHGETWNIVSAYAPQVGCDDEVKESFWRELEQEISSTPNHEKLFLGGDLNAHIGKRTDDTTERVRGRWGTGVENEEGKTLIEFAVATDLAVCNTFFQKNESQLITYRSGGTKSQIDFILCRRQQLKEVKNCKVINNEAVTPQHRVVVIDCEYEVKKKTIEKKRTIPRIKWWSLKDPMIRNQFKNEVLIQVEKSEKSDWWKKTSVVIKDVGEKILGKTSGKGAPRDKETWWWDESVQKAVKEKKIAKKRWDETRSDEDKARYKETNKEAKKAVARAKAKAFSIFYESINKKEGEKKLFRIAKERDKASKDFNHIRQIKDEQGVVLREEREIKERWKTYFEKLLNEENPRNVFEEGTPNEGMTAEISREEVVLAVKKMKNGKATGPDEIPVEAWKSLGEKGIDILWKMMKQIYERERIPDEWRESEIVPIYKQKGDIQDANNYRGIKLMPHTMKIWERIVEHRLRAETEISKEQFGFMPGKSTTDAIFALRQLMEKYLEKGKPLYFVFIDLEKAYDRVPRSEIWRCMRQKGAPEKYVTLVRDMYKDAKTKIRSSVGTTDWINVKVGLHQGSAISPYLFDMVMDVITESIRDETPWSMMFADDVVLCGPKKEDVERKLEYWRKALEDRGLKVNKAKTVQLNFGESRNSNILIDGQNLNIVEEFKYLGSTLAKDGSLEKEINHRINAGWMNWKKTSGVLCDKNINLKTKGMMYKTIVRPALTYGAETWALKKTEEKRLETTEMKMLRWMCGVTRLDKIRNEIIRGKVKVLEISKKIQEKRLQWYGHIERRDEEYVGNKVREMEVEGQRGRGRPKKKWINNINEDLREKQLTGNEVQNRHDWRQLTRNVDPA